MITYNVLLTNHVASKQIKLRAHSKANLIQRIEQYICRSKQNWHTSIITGKNHDGANR